MLKEVIDVIVVLFKLAEVVPDIMGDVVEVATEVGDKVVGVIRSEIGDTVFPEAEEIIIVFVLALIGDVGVVAIPKFEADVFVVPRVVGELVFVTVEVLLEVEIEEIPGIIVPDIFVLFYVFILLFFYVNSTQFVIGA